MAFIVQGKPREPEGIVKVVAETRTEALQAARDMLDRGMVVVTVIGDGRVYIEVEDNGAGLAEGIAEHLQRPVEREGVGKRYGV